MAVIVLSIHISGLFITTRGGGVKVVLNTGNSLNRHTS